MSTVAVKERPILFSGAMVRAILDDRKTQTRRVIAGINEAWAGGRETPHVQANRQGTLSHSVSGQDGAVQPETCGQNVGDVASSHLRCCPYQVGMKLWVRESLQQYGGNPPTAQYRADLMPVVGKHASKIDEHTLGCTPGGKAVWRWQRATCPSIHMPRWASRITLEVTRVRVERVQDISPQDAITEGCMPSRGSGFEKPEILRAAAERVGGPYPRGVFAVLWDSINARRGYGWDVNPWVWAVDFRRLENKEKR